MSDDLISRQSVINLIRRCNSALEEPRIFESHHSGNLFECYITELQPVNPQEPKWIPVSERLPERSGYYLTTNGYHEVYSDYWEGTRFDCTDVVIAWMPLPKPYKAESEDDE